MATQAQINANRKNAEKSTGPKTPEGKAKSCMNRRSHGFTSSLSFLKFENREEFDALLADLTSEFQPATPNEQMLLEKMALNHWNSLRAMNLQTIVLNGTLHHGKVSKDFGLFLRYQTTADRAYHKCHAELLKAQKERVKSGIGFESKSFAETAEAAEAPVETPQKPAAAAPIDFDSAIFMREQAFEDEIERIMNAPIEELMVSGH